MGAHRRCHDRIRVRHRPLLDRNSRILQMQGHRPHDAGHYGVAWDMISIVGGVMLIIAGLLRYRKTRVQVGDRDVRTAGVIVDLVSVVLAVFGRCGGVYWTFIETGRTIGSGSATMGNENEKELAGRASARFVNDGENCWTRHRNDGSYAVQAIADRVKSGLKILGIPTSVRTGNWREAWESR